MLTKYRWGQNFTSPFQNLWKDESQNHTVIIGKGSNTQKCWKTKEFVGAEGFFWRTADSLTVQHKQETHEQLSLNKNTAVDHSENNTVLIQGGANF